MPYCNVLCLSDCFREVHWGPLPQKNRGRRHWMWRSPALRWFPAPKLTFLWQRISRRRPSKPSTTWWGHVAHDELLDMANDDRARGQTCGEKEVAGMILGDNQGWLGGYLRLWKLSRILVSVSIIGVGLQPLNVAPSIPVLLGHSGLKTWAPASHGKVRVRDPSWKLPQPGAPNCCHSKEEVSHPAHRIWPSTRGSWRERAPFNSPCRKKTFTIFNAREIFENRLKIIKLKSEVRVSARPLGSSHSNFHKRFPSFPVSSRHERTISSGVARGKLLKLPRAIRWRAQDLAVVWHPFPLQTQIPHKEPQNELKWTDPIDTLSIT